MPKSVCIGIACAGVLRIGIECSNLVVASKMLLIRPAERLKRSIAINLVIAWRIMLMTLLGRETSELPAAVLFSDIEIEVLRAFAKKKTNAA